MFDSHKARAASSECEWPDVNALWEYCFYCLTFEISCVMPVVRRS